MRPPPPVRPLLSTPLSATHTDQTRVTLACIKDGKNGIVLAVSAIPRASKTEIVDITGDRCRMRVKAPPVDGEANEALIAFLARLFEVPKRSVALAAGSTGRQKRFEIAGTTSTQAEAILAAAVVNREHRKAQG